MSTITTGGGSWADKTQDRAYIDAGYRPDRGAASRLSANVNIQARVRELQERAAEKAVLSAAWVLERLVKVHDRSMEGQPVLDRYGNPTGATIKNFAGANRALELIGKSEGIACSWTRRT